MVTNLKQFSQIKNYDILIRQIKQLREKSIFVIINYFSVAFMNAQIVWSKCHFYREH